VVTFTLRQALLRGERAHSIHCIGRWVWDLCISQEDVEKINFWPFNSNLSPSVVFLVTSRYPDSEATPYNPELDTTPCSKHCSTLTPPLPFRHGTSGSGLVFLYIVLAFFVFSPLIMLLHHSLLFSLPTPSPPFPVPPSVLLDLLIILTPDQHNFRFSKHR
jgi:hypothetical protein